MQRGYIPVAVMGMFYFELNYVLYIYLLTDEN